MAKGQENEIVYEYFENGEVTAYVLPMSGSGLWGTIYGYLAVSSDLGKIIGIDFISHSETITLFDAVRIEIAK